MHIWFDGQLYFSTFSNEWTLVLEFLADCQILASVLFHGYGISFTGTLSRSIKVVNLATHQIRFQTMGYSHMGFSQCAVQNRVVFFLLPLGFCKRKL